MAHSHDWLRITVNVVAMIASVLGLLGVFRQNASFLSAFLVLLLFEAGMELILVITNFTKNKPVQHVTWNLVLLGIFLIGAAATADLRSRMSFSYSNL